MLHAAKKQHKRKEYRELVVKLICTVWIVHFRMKHVCQGKVWRCKC